MSPINRVGLGWRLPPLGGEDHAHDTTAVLDQTDESILAQSDETISCATDVNQSEEEIIAEF